jgi:hypothetical protein
LKGVFPARDFPFLLLEGIFGILDPQDHFFQIFDFSTVLEKTSFLLYRERGIRKKQFFLAVLEIVENLGRLGFFDAHERNLVVIRIDLCSSANLDLARFGNFGAGGGQSGSARGCGSTGSRITHNEISRFGIGNPDVRDCLNAENRDDAELFQKPGS